MGQLSSKTDPVTQSQNTNAKFSAFLSTHGVAQDNDGQVARNLTFLYERGRLPNLDVDALDEATVLLVKRGHMAYAFVILWRGVVVLEGEEKDSSFWCWQGLEGTIAWMVQEELCGK